MKHSDLPPGVHIFNENINPSDSRKPMTKAVFHEAVARPLLSHCYVCKQCSVAFSQVIDHIYCEDGQPLFDAWREAEIID